MRHGFVARNFNDQFARARREENRVRQLRRQEGGNRQEPEQLNPADVVDRILQLDPFEEVDDINNEIARFERAIRFRDNIIRQQNPRIARQEFENRNPNEIVPDLVELSDSDSSDDERERGNNQNGFAQRLENPIKIIATMQGSDSAIPDCLKLLKSR